MGLDHLNNKHVQYSDPHCTNENGCCSLNKKWLELLNESVVYSTHEKSC